MTRLNYKDSGVDVAAADKLVGKYRRLAAETNQEGVLAGVGGFAGFMALPPGYRQPVLTACTDGVGTKLRLLIDRGLHRTAGLDAAAMCLNDLATSGARPLFMLDYLATGVLEPAAAAEVVAGFAQYCRSCHCALLGGETAEMPGFYPPGDYDVAGFAVGVVERDEVVDGSRCSAGDAVIGLASAGVHSNGFSLVRALLDRGLLCPDAKLWQQLLAPTRLYLPLVRELLQQAEIRAMAHITGGGISGNAARPVPDGLDVELDWGSWPVPRVFGAIEAAGVERKEMVATFNMGLGYIVVVPRQQAAAVVQFCSRRGIPASQVGRLVAGCGRVRINGL